MCALRRKQKVFRGDKIFNKLPEHIKEQIFNIAAGKLIYFPKNPEGRIGIDKMKVLFKYIKKEDVSYNDVAKEVGISRMRVCQIVNEERERYSEERIRFWWNEGLSCRAIAKLYRKSHETIRKLVNNEGKK